MPILIPAKEPNTPKKNRQAGMMGPCHVKVSKK